MRTVLRNVQLFDGGVRGRVPKATVIISGDRIAAVLDDAEALSVGQDDAMHDLGGKTLLSGMINCHAHLGWDARADASWQSYCGANGLRLRRTHRIRPAEFQIQVKYS
jgi:imidazolonepropionase-like amidohydrolase